MILKSFFKGGASLWGRRNDKGNMNPGSTNESYKQKLDELKGALKMLTLKIMPKIYEYGFLKE
jgi:hypothetical protein